MTANRDLLFFAASWLIGGATGVFCGGVLPFGPRMLVAFLLAAVGLACGAAWWRLES